jgi:hypothetical protein
MPDIEISLFEPSFQGQIERFERFGTLPDRKQCFIAFFSESFRRRTDQIDCFVEFVDLFGCICKIGKQLLDLFCIGGTQNMCECFEEVSMLARVLLM